LALSPATHTHKQFSPSSITQFMENWSWLRGNEEGWKGKIFLPPNVRCLHPFPTVFTPLEYHESKLLLYAAVKQEEQTKRGKRGKLNRISMEGSPYNAVGNSYCAQCLISHTLLLSHSIIRSCNLVSTGRIKLPSRNGRCQDLTVSLWFGSCAEKRLFDEDNIKMNLEYTELEVSDCNWFMIETTGQRLWTWRCNLDSIKDNKFHR
jgi:hypothetical protein